jgi:DNA-binding transcriptional MerR regulator
VPQVYSSAQARKIAGVSQRCLDYWDEKGIVRPSAKAASGKGTVRRYAFEDLLKLAVVKRLRTTGLSLQRIRKGLTQLKKRLEVNDVLADQLLVTDGRKLYRICKNREIEDVLANGQLVLSIVAVGQLHDEIKTRTLPFARADRANPRRRKRRAV